MKSLYLSVGTLAFCVAVSAGSALAEPVTSERLLNAGSEAEAGNWLMVHRTYDSNRFAPLNEINRENVGDLKLAFAVPIGGLEPSGFGVNAFEGTPLVIDGTMFLADAWGAPYRIDVSSGTHGQIDWICDVGVERDSSLGVLAVNRGVAAWNDLIVTALSDGRVVACDQEFGDVMWDVQVATDPGEGFTSAPLAVGDKILVGQSYGDWATRGWIAALDAATGEEVWRFYTVPEPGQPGSETWLCEQAGNPDCWKTGGAAAWVTGSYDPESNTTIWGTGNPVPMFDPEYRPGDNLYSNSAVALDMDSGELKWHFQYTPGDFMDYDEVGVHLLMDVEVDGETRKVVSHFGRNGFFYTLDRNNGSFVHASQYVEKLDWTEGIDPKTGMPLNYDPTKALQEYVAEGGLTREGGVLNVCPHIQGGVNFWPTAYNPLNGQAYGAGIEGCSTLETVEVASEDVTAGAIFQGGASADSGEQDGSIFAFDVATGEQTAKVIREYPNYAGVLATPELVFTGEIDGTFGAFDADTLETLWSINIGNTIKAPPITYTVDGKQYVAIVGGSLGLGSFGHPELETRPANNMLFVFAL